MIPMIMANDFLFVFFLVTIALSCLRYENIVVVNFQGQLPFQPFPVVIGPRGPVGSTFSMGFLVAFCSDHIPKMHCFCPRGMGQTDRWTDGCIAASLDAL